MADVVWVEVKSVAEAMKVLADAVTREPVRMQMATGTMNALKRRGVLARRPNNVFRATTRAYVWPPVVRTWEEANETMFKRESRNLMSGKPLMMDEDTPNCCDPGSETYWSM